MSASLGKVLNMSRWVRMGVAGIVGALGGLITLACASAVRFSSWTGLTVQKGWNIFQAAGVLLLSPRSQQVSFSA